ncbi:muscle M-line assembly protein unc-89 [Hippoglossus stenolepis]|uniref:muscle M-line assembly protein unc-89 n=1 Tax=Hippoglossus stenolepis TaxID=195615 RepID=UPI001FAF5A5C|nr:muscle M-line assembly protein unc-89 [Hippoglossus stenolepis]
METKYPTLRRPKRKLCYLTNKDSGSKKWTGTMTLGDVDKMFDDLDSPSRDDGLLSTSPLIQTSDTRTPHSDRAASPAPQEGHQSKRLPPCEKGPEGAAHPAIRPPSPQLDIVSDLFKLHEPVKTSSPIDKIVSVVDVEEENNDGKQVVSPILFDCGEEEKEEAQMQPPTIQEPQVNGHVTEIIGDSGLDTPPSKFAFKRPTVSTHKNKVDGSCKDSQPVTEKTHEKPQTAVFECKRKTQRQKSTDKPVGAVTREPELTAPDKQSTSVHSQSLGETSTRVGNDMSAFLQKLRDAGQSKPACGRKSLTPVKVPPPPEPEDDFLILEDDAPLWFTIPSKTATSKRQKQSRTDSSDKDSSTDKATKDSPQETGQKEVESEKAELGIHPLDLSTQRKKRPEKKNKVTVPGNDKDELTTPEDLPAGDSKEQEKPNKKKRQQQLKKIPSKESNKAEEEPKDTASRKTDKEKLSQKTQKKKSVKSSKDVKEVAKTNTTKSLKRTRKVTQSPEDIKETASDEAVKEQSEDHNKAKPGDVEDLGSLSDKQIMNSDAQTVKDNKLPAVTETSSSEESPILGKRKRKPIGQWWMSGPESTEETKVPDNHLTHKRSKQHSKEPSAAEASPVKTKKVKVLKKINQKRPVTLISQNTTKGKAKKTRQNKNRPAGGDAPNKMRATDEVLNTTDTEQIEAQQHQPEEEDVLDQDLDFGQSSPMVFQERDINPNSGQQVCQKVYHNVSNEKMSDTSASVSPRGPQEHLKAEDPEKRRRKPPGNWWTTNSMSEEVESVSTHPQHLKPKESKSHNERKQLSKQKPSRSPGLGTPKKGKRVVASKTPGGADVPLLKSKPMFAPKTVKRTLATFKDIFASETPTVVSSRHTGHNNRCEPAEVSVIERVTFSPTDIDTHSVDAGEFRSPQNSPPTHDTPQDSSCQPENTLKDLRSGPSSMIEIQEYENLTPQPSSVPGALSVSDLCAPPLKPLVLQPKDKADLTEWFKTLWSSTVDDDGEISPDHFDWYFYQGRVCGFQVDLNCSSICNGKILLGSYMKKPLWVDHSATTVFNILTSSVAVIIDGRKSHFHPGQAFMVQSGHAYSIDNVTAQPAVLYFTRILAESSE